MKVLYLLIGFLFDLVILAAGAALLALAVQPGLLDAGLDLFRPLLDTTTGRAQIGGAALACIVLSFRALFLALFGKSDREFVVRTGEKGEISISHSSLQRILARLVEEKGPGGELRRGVISPRGEMFDLRLKVRLDLVNVNLTEYAATLEDRIRDHFTNTLGVALGNVRIQAECTAPRRNQ